jgi:hypothetical protein
VFTENELGDAVSPVGSGDIVIATTPLKLLPKSGSALMVVANELPGVISGASGSAPRKN